MNNFYVQMVLLLLVAIGVFNAPINSHLQNGAFLILAIVAFVLFVLAHKKLDTLRQKSEK